ncbi:MAG: homoserine kinase [Lautropia sp.]
MAVFTPVSERDLTRWLDLRFGVGSLVRVEPIAQGVENTNYFVDTTAGRFVLTLVERVAESAIDFHVGLMEHLAAAGIRCPAPVPARDGRLWGRLNGKPATLVTRLDGRPCAHPGAAEVRAVGALLADMHLAAAHFASPAPANPRGLGWWPAAARDLAPRLSADDASLMHDELAVQLAFASGDRAAGAGAPALPRSAVHADLFRDNVLFDDTGAPGAIDFWFACDESWLFDLAVTCNDWCLADGDAGPGADGAILDAVRLHALIAGYVSRRPLGPAEVDAWPTMLRAAAFRFWMSRLHDALMPREASLLAAKDPDGFRQILLAHREAVPPLPAAPPAQSDEPHGNTRCR